MSLASWIAALKLDQANIAAIVAFGQVVLIDITLAGDNAVVVGLAVAGLPRKLKSRAILAGITLATLIRVGLSLVAVKLLAVIGLTLAGGLLLLWVCWKMLRELRHGAHGAPHGAPQKTLRQAIWQIAVADLSMSLDNVLAVAGAAHAHIWVMVAGLALSILLMAAAANLLASILERQRWIAWAGLAVVVYVAGKMIGDGWAQVAPYARHLNWSALHV
jgi:YjbE family integral membrane protein